MVDVRGGSYTGLPFAFKFRTLYDAACTCHGQPWEAKAQDRHRQLAAAQSLAPLTAVAAPQASFGGKSPYKNMAEVAAAYLFFLCKNHPFIDGNKRAALGACLVFLRLNGMRPKADGPA